MYKNYRTNKSAMSSSAIVDVKKQFTGDDLSYLFMVRAHKFSTFPRPHQLNYDD